LILDKLLTLEVKIYERRDLDFCEFLLNQDLPRLSLVHLKVIGSFVGDDEVKNIASAITNVSAIHLTMTDGVPFWKKWHQISNLSFFAGFTGHNLKVKEVTCTIPLVRPGYGNRDDVYLPLERFLVDVSPHLKKLTIQMPFDFTSNMPVPRPIQIPALGALKSLHLLDHYHHQDNSTRFRVLAPFTQNQFPTLERVHFMTRSMKFSLFNEGSFDSVKVLQVDGKSRNGKSMVEYDWKGVFPNLVHFNHS